MNNCSLHAITFLESQVFQDDFECVFVIFLVDELLNQNLVIAFSDFNVIVKILQL